MDKRESTHQKRYLVGAILAVSLLTTNASAEPIRDLTRGASVYVSIYSNVYVGPKATPLQLASMDSRSGCTRMVALALSAAWASPSKYSWT